MDLMISNSSNKPIYEQIANQIKGKIMNGDLAPGEILPSMRLLAKELRISVITTKRAYTDLEKEGFIEIVAGKGSFVASQSTSLIREEQLRQIEEYLFKAIDLAKTGDIMKKEIFEIINILYEGE